MISDRHGRPLRNLRLSVTDRCNLRCSYCMPEADYVWLPREDILHFEEIETLVDVFIGLGVDKIRLTGGEPLLRRDVPDLVARLARRAGVRDLAMTTNGVLLAAHAAALKAAGLHRLTVSLDTLHADRFRALTRYDELDRVRGGHRGGRAALPGTEDRLGGDPRRERRRAGAAAGVRARPRRGGALHRVHGRGRRHPLVDGTRGVSPGHADGARRALRAPSNPCRKTRPRRPIDSGCPTGWCSASSRPPPRPSARRATAAG